VAVDGVRIIPPYGKIRRWIHNIRHLQNYLQMQNETTDHCCPPSAKRKSYLPTKSQNRQFGREIAHLATLPWTKEAEVCGYWFFTSWSISEKFFAYPYSILIRKFLKFSRDEHGSGLDRTGSGLKPILAGTGLDRTAFFFLIGGSGLDRTEKIFVALMWLFWKYLKFKLWSDFTGFLNGSVYFATKCKNSAGTILQFELYPPLFTYNVEF